MKHLLMILVVMGAGLVRAAEVKGAGYFTLTPASGSYTAGSNFTVLVGVNSGEDEVAGIDVRGNFDAAKIKLVSMEKVEGAEAWSFLEYDQSLVSIDNTAGTFAASLAAAGTGTGVTGQKVNEVLLRLNFTAKAAGTAGVTFRCETGSVADSNIINKSYTDVVDCSLNQSGSYEIGAGSGGDATASPTPTTIGVGGGAATATPTGAAELPQTGGAGSTVGLVVFGVISLLGALMLRLI